MRILIATGIFEPENGGPATVSKLLASELSNNKHSVVVLTYSDFKKYENDSRLNFEVHRVSRRKGKIGRVINYLIYFLETVHLMKNCDIVYTLDSFASGIPVFIASKIMHKKYSIRIGGDYIWEKYIQEGNTPISIYEFNKLKYYKKYNLIYFLIKLVINNANIIIVNSNRFAEIIIKHYIVDSAKVNIIENPVPSIEIKGLLKEKTNEIIFAGRVNSVKNVSTLIKGFVAANVEKLRLGIIGDGPDLINLKHLVNELNVGNKVTFYGSMHGSDFYNKISSAKYLVLPSWSDISPNQFYEAMALHVPMLITKENFLSEYPTIPLMINPSSENDISNKILLLENDVEFKKLANYFSKSVISNKSTFLKKHYLVLKINK